MEQTPTNLQMEHIPLSRLHPHPDNDYPTSEKELSDLMESIRSDGLAQLPLVRPHEGDYQIIAGHRRVECYRRLAKEDPEGYEAIPCNVAADCNDERALILSDVTNLMTRQLTPSSAPSASSACGRPCPRRVQPPPRSRACARAK